MMELPEVTKCFGIFPPKHATYMISLFGLASGGAGIAGIVLYGLIEKAITAFFLGNSKQKMDDAVKKVVLLTLGLTSLLMLVGNILLFLGATSSSRGALSSGVIVLLVMCLIIIFEAIGLPLFCFFHEPFCVIKKLSTLLVVLSSLIITIFLELWLYFIAVANSYLVEL
ncbi:uncharacterized protein LOC116778167 [Danaus plexippus]|uniref:uncharacterized protein LOC116778167 n=1 Tax=Danaus plexippus TaxID=13037 RepID=UPI0013C4F409|nr:uncharacterized protein LOC116778167 [Danaus plexippus]